MPRLEVKIVAHSLTSDDLTALASRAVSMYFAGEGSLTDTITKVGSSADTPLTAEHVKRICEMAFRDAYEKHYKQASGQDRYVSFDPPESTVVIKNLRAGRSHAKTASASHLLRVGDMNMLDKTASAPMHPKKYQPLNAFDSMTKSAKAPEILFENPLGDVYRLRQNIFEAIRDMESRYASVDASEKHAMFELFGHAAAAARQGHGVADVLYACMGDDDSFPPKVAEYVATEVTTHLGRKGFSISDGVKVASDVNPNHPLPLTFKKVAEFLRTKLELEMALVDLRKDLREFDEQLRHAS